MANFAFLPPRPIQRTDELRFGSFECAVEALKTAIAMAEESARAIGIAAVVVHPINEQAANFYLARGFVFAKQGEAMLVYPLLSSISDSTNS